MNEKNEINVTEKPKTKRTDLATKPLKLCQNRRQGLDSTGEKLDKYIAYASRAMNTEITSGDCLEHALKLLFDRDSGFKAWLKEN